MLIDDMYKTCSILKFLYFPIFFRIGSTRDLKSNQLKTIFQNYKICQASKIASVVCYTLI